MGISGVIERRGSEWVDAKDIHHMAGYTCGPMKIGYLSLVDRGDGWLLR